MAHFAHVDDQNIVDQVLVVEQDVIDSGEFGDPSKWVQTSYNTRGGVYYTPNSDPITPDPDQSKAFRKNYAGIGYIWDAARDAFYGQQPFPSWSLDEFSCLWEAPVPFPSEPGDWQWDEAEQKWVNTEA